MSGIAIGGLFAVGSLSVAVAFADSYPLPSGEMIEPAPGSTLDVTGFYGITTGAPAADGSVQGTQTFDVLNSSGDVIGSFNAFVGTNMSNVTSSTNEEMLVSSIITGTPGSVPPVGSILDYLGAGNPQFSSDYTDLVSTDGGANTINDPVTTPFGTFNFSNALDAAAHVDPHVEKPIPLADGYSIVADPNASESFIGINGLPPIFVAGQGTQLFDLDDSTGQTVGTFTADVTTTGDGLTGHSIALLVTSDVTGTPGQVAGDVPTPGSVFNQVYVFNPNIVNTYADIASPTPGGTNAISNVFNVYGVTLNGSTAFDGVKGLTDGFIGNSPQIESIPLADGLKAVPVGTETYSGIDGQPGFFEEIQGYQQFNVENSSGTVVATFNADVTNYAGGSVKDEALLVTQVGTGGTAPGDAPPVGSWLEYTDDGNGFATNYADLVGASQNTVSETWITPFGDFNIPTTVDAAQGLAGLDFFVPPDLSL
ncbi:hypothetical protein KIH27_12580 [Mycobacterium sp. M1]|uniref:Uncharacterized protein n=1 Tax=Mycolicibacter acidiphilus TaxID=2835306 RepID=A0ABS5RJF2_9MYCO|nr:hypothetical protein [Mycolicibacter acidiphilus]MBS9534421.1 hypothetical protein [Mycolicibacter acidiphilus]